MSIMFMDCSLPSVLRPGSACQIRRPRTLDVILIDDFNSLIVSWDCPHGARPTEDSRKSRPGSEDFRVHSLLDAVTSQILLISFPLSAIWLMFASWITFQGSLSRKAGRQEISETFLRAAAAGFRFAAAFESSNLP